MGGERDSQHVEDLAHALARSEDRFRLFVESVVDYAMFMLDPGGHVATWNIGAERIKGYRPDEIIGRHFSAFYPREDVAAGKCEHELDVAGRTGRFEDEGWRVRKDGTRFWANVIISAVRDGRGKLLGFSKVTRDLTERKRAEEERVRLAETEAALRLRDEFLSIASHELKTPLTSLLLQLERLRGRMPDPALRVGVERSLRAGRRLTALIETLLDVSRIATGKLTLQREPFDLADAAAEVIDRVREESDATSTPIELHRRAVAAGSWDRLRIEQILHNLLSNALKYAPGAKVDVVVERAGDLVTVQVVDHGSGFDQADVDRIFERFERGVPMRNFAGLGLGLYVSRQIAQAHGGELTAENAAGAGARFTLRLPLAT